MFTDIDGKEVHMKRIFLIVLDSFGIGAMEDASDYGDSGANTLESVVKSPYFSMPNMAKLGLFHMDGVTCTEPSGQPKAVIARLQEASKGKDTTIGHWEIAGIYSQRPLPTYPEGFPEQVIEAFERQTGRGVLCNRPYSGTEVIRDYGQEHMQTGKLIVYTSADSVFQIAAHEEVVPVEELYRYCQIARQILQGEHGVGRVIARPFVGKDGKYERTSRRHDYSLVPPCKTMLDVMQEAGYATIGVGKIRDIFAGRGVSEYVYTQSNTDGIARTLEYMDREFEGLCFVNLVDFDSKYGHRNDVDGYAKALAEFDQSLPQMLEKLGEEDILMITADHGCDPGYTVSTDHTREYVPFLMYGSSLTPRNLGTRKTFADVAATVLQYFQICPDGLVRGESML